MMKIPSSLTPAEEIFVRLNMDHKDIEIAGMVGEFAASKVFDQVGVGWVDLGQKPDHYSTFLKSLSAHRPDYLVCYGGCSILIDVKTYRPRQQGDSGHRFGVTEVEWTALRATQEATGIPVATFFWNKLAPGRFEYTICVLDDLTICHTDAIGSWRCRDFAAFEFSTIRLSAA